MDSPTFIIYDSRTKLRENLKCCSTKKRDRHITEFGGLHFIYKSEAPN